MKVKNVSNSFLFPVGNLVGDDQSTITRKPDESDEDYGKRSNELRGKMAESSAIRAANAQAKAAGKDQVPESTSVADLQAAINPERLARYKALGVELPSDLLRVTMTLGSLVFDLFTVTAKQPAAPLAAALFNKRVQSLAGRLQKDDFDLHDDLLAQVRPALEDESIWTKTNLTIYTLVGGQKSYLQVNNTAAGFFPDVVNAAIGIFVPAEAAPEETPAVAEAAAPEAAAQPAPAPLKAVPDAPQQATPAPEAAPAVPASV